MDSVEHRGEGRYNWLVEAGHVEAVEQLPGIVARFGPAFWQGGKGWWLQGNVEGKRYLEPDGYKTNWDGCISAVAKLMKRFRSGRAWKKRFQETTRYASRSRGSWSRRVRPRGRWHATMHWPRTPDPRTTGLCLHSAPPTCGRAWMF